MGISKQNFICKKWNLVKDLNKLQTDIKNFDNNILNFLYFNR